MRMRDIVKATTPGPAFLAGLTLLLLGSCNSRYLDGMIVAVELSGSGITCEGARLIAIDPDRPGKPAKVISEGFTSACAPDISPAGRYLLFQGKRQESDPWQIWAMDLEKKKTTQVTDMEADCTDPAFLPDGQVVFSMESNMMGRKVSHLYVCHRDGCCLEKLTYHPAADRASTVLKEGRILYLSSRQVPEPAKTVFFVMRPNGTKSEVYHYGVPGKVPLTGGAESDDGFVYFIEGDPEGEGWGKPVRLVHKRPLHSREELGSGGQFLSVLPDGPGSCLVSYREQKGDTFTLHRYDPGSGKIGEPVYRGEGHVFDPVLVVPEKRPRILPNDVSHGESTALLMSQDINHSMLAVHPGLSGDSLADRIRISGMEGELGRVQVEEDGSFYLKIDADMPFRIETLNSRGEVVRGPSDWIWLRPGTRRGCVGCHADPEMAPENRVPVAVTGPPAIVSKQNNAMTHIQPTEP